MHSKKSIAFALAIVACLLAIPAVFAMSRAHGPTLGARRAQARLSLADKLTEAPRHVAAQALLAADPR